ncbi:MAG: replication initiation protein [Bacteroidota bacterium]
MSKKTYDIVRFDDKLVYHGSYQISSRAIKTIMYMVSRYIDPIQDDKLPNIINVPIAEIAKAITDGGKATKSNSLYDDIDGLCDELTSSRIRFNSSVKIEGVELKGYLVWCSSAIPREIDGQKHISFGFDPNMGQFLLGLSKYVRLYRPELNRLRSGHAIRLFQMLKGIRNKKRKFSHISREIYSIDRLKFLFGIEDRYKEFKYFNKDVIKPVVKEINKKTTIQVLEVNKIRRGGRNTSHLEFVFTDQQPDDPLPYRLEEGDLKDFVPTEDNINRLSKAEHQAYQILVNFKVKEGIAFSKILPEIKGSESYGFEDYFVTYALQHFQKWAKNQNTPEQAAATFVSWWTKHSIYDTTTEAWVQINEQVSAVRKNMERNNPHAFDNRITAREMTKAEFENWYKTRDWENDQQPTLFDKGKNSDFEGIGEILKKTGLEE